MRRSCRSTQGADIQTFLLPALILVVAIVLGAVIYFVTRERARISRFGRDAELPPLIVPVRSGSERLRPLMPSRPPVHQPSYAPPPPPPGYGGTASGSAGNGRSPFPPFDTPPDGATVRFHRPLDEPVQLLPGRLEVTEGADRGQDIRFFRIPGEPTTVTIGRGDGSPYRHIRLRAPTVSRTHARMQFEDGRWKIVNMSETNPVVINGNELSGREGGHWLADGDRIEIGEVVLRFHAHAGDRG